MLVVPTPLILCLVAAAASASASNDNMYQNPVIPTQDTPDPGITYCPELDLWLASTTTGGLPAYHLHTSSNLANWTDIGFMFQTQLSWAGTDGYWAPEIHFVGGTYVAYYVARNRATGTLSIGAAVSQSGTCIGPYADIGKPLVTHPTMGQIDATFFADIDGSAYLIFKEDGNAVNQPTPIHIAQLTPNGTALTAEASNNWRSTELITCDLPWEHGITEAPWVVRYADAYYLFYSASGYYDGSYAVGVARSMSIQGPYVKLGVPILKNSTTTPVVFEGPGHCSVVQDVTGNYMMFYHAWRGADRSFRVMMMDQVTWTPQGVNNTIWPSVGNNGAPSTTPQIIP